MQKWQRHLTTLAAGLLLVCATTAAATAEGVRAASFNIQHLGYNNDKNFDAVARIIATMDIVAVQEMMNQSGAYDLHSALQRKTGVEWGILYSDALGRSTYREHYLFLYREDRVRYQGQAVVYIDDRDVFARPPFSASFVGRAGEPFVLSNVHITSGQRIADRTVETDALASYWTWLEEVYTDVDPGRIAILGDFNLPPHHSGFEALRQHATPLPINRDTTLSTIDGYANPFDHIFVPHGEQFGVAGYGKIDLMARLSETTGLNWNNAAVRNLVSDHAPVYFVFDGATQKYPMRVGEIRTPVWDHADETRTASVTPDCIDLNEATERQLTALPGIGEVRAQQIVEGRPWAGASELQRIGGVGPAIVRDIEASGSLCR